MIRYALVGLIVVVGCGKSKAPAEKVADAGAAAKQPAKAVDAGAVAKEPVAPVADAAVAAAPAADAAVAAVAGVIVVGTEGVDGLGALPATLDKAKAAFPGYQVEAVVPDEDDEYGEEHIAVKKGDELILEIYPSRISIESPSVHTVMGLHVGETYAFASKMMEGTLKCEDGGQYGDNTEGYVFCSSEMGEHFSLDFMDLDEEGSPVRPGAELLDSKKLLAKSTLARIVWH